MINAFLGDVLGQGWAHLLNRGPQWILMPPVSDYQLAESLPGKNPVYSRNAFYLSTIFLAPAFISFLACVQVQDNTKVTVCGHIICRSQLCLFLMLSDFLGFFQTCSLCACLLAILPDDCQLYLVSSPMCEVVVGSSSIGFYVRTPQTCQSGHWDDLNRISFHRSNLDPNAAHTNTRGVIDAKILSITSLGHGTI